MREKQQFHPPKLEKELKKVKGKFLYESESSDWPNDRIYENSSEKGEKKDEKELKKVKGKFLYESESSDWPNDGSCESNSDKEQKDQSIGNIEGQSEKETGVVQYHHHFGNRQENFHDLRAKKRSQPETIERKRFHCSKKVKINEQFALRKDEPLTNLNKQIALIAVKIYKTILHKPQGINLRQKSLHQMILEIINEKRGDKKVTSEDQISQQASQFVYTQEARKPFLDLFVNGIRINHLIFSQNRIALGTFMISDETKFVFFPTYLVTSQVFHYLHYVQYLGRYKLLTGHYGIAKTVSTCLYWHLTQLINKYRFSGEYEKLDQVILQSIPKLIYLTINIDAQITSKKIEKLILDQCPEYKKKYQISEQNPPNWEILPTIQSFYGTSFEEKNFPVIMVYDQVNWLSSFWRQKKQILQKIEKGKIIKQHIKDYRTIQWFLLFKQFVQLFASHFSGTVFQSSIGIQNKFFNKVNFTCNPRQPIPTKVSVNYNEHIFQDDSMFEIIHYYWFELKSRILNTVRLTFKSEVLQYKIKQVFYKVLKEKQQKDFFITPESIRAVLSEKRQKFCSKLQSEHQSQDSYTRCLKQIFLQVIKKSTQHFSKNLEDHLRKRDQKDTQRIYLWTQIYKFLLANKNSLNNLTAIPLKCIKLSEQEIENVLQKKIFQLDNEQIKLLLPIQLIIKTMKPHFKQKIDTILKIQTDFIDKISDRGTLGNIIQTYFHLCIFRGDFELKWKILESQTQEKYRKISISINQNQVYRFKPLENKQKSSILQRFRSVICDMQKNQQMNAVLFPVKKVYLLSEASEVLSTQINTLSKLIDFVFIKKENYIVKIYLIDLTVGQKQVTKKLVSFLNFFLTATDKHQQFMSFDGKQSMQSTQGTNLQKQKPILSKRLKVQVEYLVFAYKSQIQIEKLKQTLQYEFSGKIGFNFQQGNSFSINIAGSHSCLLKSVGWLNMEKDLKFKSLNEDFKPFIRYFNEISNRVYRKIQILDKIQEQEQLKLKKMTKMKKMNKLHD